ncbi:hypothetical protein SAZ10_15730 [Mesorhizobium sp. BAC0120]|nr:hypothetical protein [Mesorhizobium sp. BAC0120]MDW6023208.1 hypothetical protein [Mesorhizobium sp. BAC0120]
MSISAKRSVLALRMTRQFGFPAGHNLSTFASSSVRGTQTLE